MYEANAATICHQWYLIEIQAHTIFERDTNTFLKACVVATVLDNLTLLSPLYASVTAAPTYHWPFWQRPCSSPPRTASACCPY